jgi:hypothetical protein
VVNELFCLGLHIKWNDVAVVSTEHLDVVCYRALHILDSYLNKRDKMKAIHGVRNDIHFFVHFCGLICVQLAYRLCRNFCEVSIWHSVCFVVVLIKDWSIYTHSLLGNISHWA